MSSYGITYLLDTYRVNLFTFRCYLLYFINKLPKRIIIKIDYKYI